MLLTKLGICSISLSFVALLSVFVYTCIILCVCVCVCMYVHQGSSTRGRDVANTLCMYNYMYSMCVRKCVCESGERGRERAHTLTRERVACVGIFTHFTGFTRFTRSVPPQRERHDDTYVTRTQVRRPLQTCVPLLHRLLLPLPLLLWQLQRSEMLPRIWQEGML